MAVLFSAVVGIICLILTVNASSRDIKHCDIVIAGFSIFLNDYSHELFRLTIRNCRSSGGSLSALAAAITAVNVSKYGSPSERNSHVCLLEPTDWPGGQLTASSVPPDFGVENRAEANLSKTFVDTILAVIGSWNANPGQCWVSTHCFEGTMYCIVPLLSASLMLLA